MAIVDTSAGDSASTTQPGTVVAVPVTNAVAAVEVLGVREALETLGDAWSALERQCPQATIFQTTAWASIVLAWRQQVQDAVAPNGCQVVVTRNHNGVLTGVWPVQVERIFGASYVVALGEPFCQYSDILVADGVDRDVVIRGMLDTLKLLDRFSGVLLRKVREDAICRGYFSRRAIPLATAAAPAVDLRPFETFDAYHGTVKSKTRKNLRNARNRLQRGDDVLEHLVHHEPDAVAAVARRAFHLRTEWLAQEGLSSRAFLDPGFEQFIETLCAAACHSDGFKLVAFELRLGAEMLSLQWGFIDGGRYYAFMAVRNPAFDAQSPGRLQLEDVIRSCAEMGVEVVDFLAPDVDYKRTWATERVGIRDYGVAFTFAGRLILSGALGAPRQRARRIFDSLPQGLRQALIGVLARRSD